MRFLFLFLLLLAPIAQAAPRLIEGDARNLRIVSADQTQIALEPQDKKAAHNLVRRLLR